jgi:hypothetical protein
MDALLLSAAAATAGTLGFAFYVQFSPSMGGIWIRVDERNVPVFVPENLVRLMAEPLRIWTPLGRNFWTRTALWPINYPLWILALVCAVYALCPCS